MVLAAAAAEDSGLTLDRGRLFAAAAELPIAVYRDDHGIAAALRHLQLQGAWFTAAAAVGGDLDRLLDTGPVAEAMGPWTERHFGWSTTGLTECIETLGRTETGLAGLLQASWGWVAAGGDPMALTIALPLAAAAQRFSARPLPGLFPRGRAVRTPARWLQLALTDLIGQVGDMTRRLQELERTRLGLREALAGLRASSRLPAVAELALSRPAISSPTVVRHLTRLARRGGPLGRTTPSAIEGRARKEAVSAAGAGQMLRQLAKTGWLVELTGSRTHRAYVARDLADLGIAMVPARLRPPPGHAAEEEPVVIPPLPLYGDFSVKLSVWVS
ncbi:MAG: hypothetical protein ACRC67_05205 [Inquilinus sp.]|uniref:hypothetical protein n=1 Tax=Inquilinus sp. TaxID=1932117 RepID=UPI003F39307D